MPKVKARIAHNQRFGVSLRLSANSAQTLVNSAAERDKLKKFLGDNDMYLYTVNAFPYGAFKGTMVKEQVYEPDWRSEERTRYTIERRRRAGRCLPARHRAFDPERAARLQAARDRRAMSSRAIPTTSCASSRIWLSLRRAPGAPSQLALEPEPYCFLETTDETVDYFTHHLYSGAAAEKLAKLAHIPISEAHGALRRHLGVVFDICHQAVEYEDIAASLQKLVDAGIPIFKLQEAAALHIPEVTQETVDTLKRYAKTIYLTQTVEKKDGKLTRFLNLEDAFAAWEKDSGAARMAHPLPRAGVSSTISGRSAPRASPSRTRCAFTRRSRCRASSRSRPIPGTCCRKT